MVLLLSGKQCQDSLLIAKRGRTTSQNLFDLFVDSIFLICEAVMSAANSTLVFEALRKF